MEAWKKNRIQETVEQVRTRFEHRQARLDGRGIFNMDYGTSGSGNWGHAGRKGLRGGSAPGGGTANRTGSKEKGFSSNAKRAATLKTYRKSSTKCDKLREKISGLFKTAGEAKSQWEHHESRASSDLHAERELAKRSREAVENYQKKGYYGKPARSEEELRKEQKELQDQYDALEKQIHDLGPLKGMSYQAKKKREQLKKDQKSIGYQLGDNQAQVKLFDDLHENEKALADSEARVAASKKWLEEHQGKNDYEELLNSLEEYDKVSKERNEAILKAYSSGADCQTAQEATDYLRALNPFKKHAKQAGVPGGGIIDVPQQWQVDRFTDLTKIDGKHAASAVGRIETLIKDYPKLKGMLPMIGTTKLSDDSVIAATSSTEIRLNESRYNRPDFDEKYRESVTKGVHPAGTDTSAVIDHEYTHAIENLINPALKKGKLADAVMVQVQKKLYGSYSKAREQEVREQVSLYAAHNNGVNVDQNGQIVVNEAYGRNTEFLAEAFSEYRCSENPRPIAVAVGQAMEAVLSKFK